MSDAILFAALFAAYAVLHTATAGGPGGAQLFDRQFVLVETLLLLTSSFTCGLAVIAARSRSKIGTWLALAATLILGLSFLGMELSEFARLVAEGQNSKAHFSPPSLLSLERTASMYSSVRFGYLPSLRTLPSVDSRQRPNAALCTSLSFGISSISSGSVCSPSFTS
jgi:hypothetical protein